MSTLYSLALQSTGTGSGAVSGGGDYEAGANITLTATPDANSLFDGWGPAPCAANFTMPANDLECTATFILKTYPLTASTTTGGTITPTSTTVTHGERGFFEVTPNPGYKIDTASGCGGTLNGSIYTTAPVTAACTVTVSFSALPPELYALTLQATGTGSGTVSGGGDFEADANITLTATPDASSTFGGWSPAPCAASFTMPADNLECVAGFTRKNYPVTASAGAGGTITPATVTVTHGETTRFTLTPENGYTIGSVTGCDGSLDGNTYTTGAVTAACTVSATFNAPGQQSLTVSKSGPGSVTGSPAGIDCGDDCNHSYDYGTSVTLTATFESPATFGGWSGCDSSNDTQCTVSMTAAKNVTATFNAPPQHTLSITKTGNGSVTSSPPGIDCGTDCTEDFDAGTQVTLSAQAGEGFAFTGWTQDCSGQDPEVTVTLDRAINCTVVFKQPPVALFSATPLSGNAPLRVVLDSRASYDPDGEIRETIWKVDDQPMTLDLSAEEKSVTFTSAGTYTLTLLVTDNDGLQAEAAPQTVTVSEANASLTISPAHQDFGTVPVLAADTTAGRRAVRRAGEISPHVPGQVIVKFQDHATPAMRQAARERYQAKLRWALTLINAEVWQVAEVDTVLATHARHPAPAVEYLEPDYLVKANATPNDPDFSAQWNLHNSGQHGGTPGADIDAPAAWDSEHGGGVCAVLDTGVDYTHPDLAANLWRNPGERPGDGIDNDGNGYVDDVYGWDFVDDDSDPMDYEGHGTHVAGILAAAGNNGQGVAGVSWSGKIMALRILGIGTGQSRAIRALEYAMDMGVKCANSSWRLVLLDGDAPPRPLYEAIREFGAQDGVFIAAAGNNRGGAVDGDRYPVYPGAYDLPNIINVCASDAKDRLAYFSYYGAGNVDLCAPGQRIFSTWYDPAQPYAWSSGTSMAAPHVAGAVLLLQAAQPALRVAQVKAQLLAAADTKQRLYGCSVSGGRLNLAESLKNLPQPRVFTVTNSGDVPLSLSNPALVGQNPAAFTMLQHDCGGDLPPQAACAITVSFTPRTAGNKQAELRVSAGDDVEATATLRGEARALVPPAGSCSEPAPAAVFNTLTLRADLPSVYLDGSTAEQIGAGLCLGADGLFEICDLNIQAGDPQALEQAGHAIFHPQSGILEIPFISLSDAPAAAEGMNTHIEGYTVDLELVTLPDGSVKFGLQELMPVW